MTTTASKHAHGHQHRPEERYSNPLISAIHDNKPQEALKLLAAKSFSVNSRTQRKETPLHFALCYSRVELIQSLVNAGAKVNKRNVEGRTPLIMGVISAELPVLKLFIKACEQAKAGLDLNKANYFGETPLHHAVCHDRPEVLELLLDLGVDPNLKTIGGVNALWMARDQKRPEMIQLLVLRGASTEECILKPLPTSTAFLPPSIKDGFLNDEMMRKHDTEFGGALFQDRLPVFHFGMRPKEGLCVEITMNFFTMLHCIKFTTMRGIIYQVDSPLKIKAIVKLNCDHEDKLKILGGEWDATLEVVANATFPWCLTSLTRFNEDSKITYASVLARAHELDKSRGRKYVLGDEKARSSKKGHQCMVLKGQESDCEDALIVTAINMVAPLQLVVRFENGPDETRSGQQAMMLFMAVVQAKLDPKGKIGVEIYDHGRLLGPREYAWMRAQTHPNMIGTNPAAAYCCDYCHQMSKIKLRKCGRCGAVTYCNEVCQDKHWPVHKKICRKPEQD